MRLRIALPTLTGLLLCSTLVFADPAADHFSEGLKLFSKKDYGGAAVELEASYKLKEDQGTLYAWAQALRLGGNCDEARALFANYIANGANEKETRAAYELMTECTPKGELPTEVTGTELVEPVESVEVKPVTEAGTTDEGGTEVATLGTGASGAVDLTTPTTTSTMSSPWYRDWVGIGLLSSGALGVVVGGVFYSSAIGLEDEARGPGVVHEEFVELKDSAQTRRSLAVGFGVAGVALVTGSVVYMLLGTGSAEQESGPLTVQVSQSGATFALSGSF